LNWVEANIPAGTSIFVVGNPLRRESLSVPLGDSVDNQMRIAADLRASGSPLKAQVVEMAARSGRSPKYNLYTVMHTDPNLTLDEYSALGVAYFVLSGYYFDPEHIDDDTRRARQTLDSRSALRRDLEARGDLLFNIDPRQGRHTGPAIKVYRVVPRKGQ
jgi:hypothetical protein